MHAKRFSQGYWTFLGPGDEKKWYGSANWKPEGNEIPSPHKWYNDSRKHVTQFHKCQCFQSNTELIFRIIHSANQLSVYGAVSSWFEEFALKPNEREPRRVRSERRFHKQGNTEVCEFTRSELFGMRAKDTNSIGQPMARKSSELEVTVQNQST